MDQAFAFLDEAQLCWIQMLFHVCLCKFEEVCFYYFLHYVCASYQSYLVYRRWLAAFVFVENDQLGVEEWFGFLIFC